MNSWFPIYNFEYVLKDSKILLRHLQKDYLNCHFADQVELYINLLCFFILLMNLMIEKNNYMENLL